VRSSSLVEFRVASLVVAEEGIDAGGEGLHASCARDIEAVGGALGLVVSDNPKTAVIKACFYEPAVNRSYTEMAAHYDTAILPARPPGRASHATKPRWKPRC
jgi:transposase